MADRAGSASVTSCVGFEKRFDPLHRYAARLIGDGFIGETRLVSVDVLTPYAVDDGYPPYYYNWTSDRGAGGGITVQDLVHLFDLIRMLFGDMTVTASDYDVVIKEKAVGPEPGAERRMCDADDTSVVIGRLRDGALVSIASSWSVHHGEGHRWEIRGSEGSLRFEPDGRLFGGKAGEPLRELTAPGDLAPIGGLPDGGRESLRRSLITTAHPTMIPLWATMAHDFMRLANGNNAATVLASFDDGLRAQELVEAVVGRNG